MAQAEHRDTSCGQFMTALRLKAGKTLDAPLQDFERNGIQMQVLESCRRFLLGEGYGEQEASHHTCRLLDYLRTLSEVEFKKHTFELHPSCAAWIRPYLDQELQLDSVPRPGAHARASAR